MKFKIKDKFKFENYIYEIEKIICNHHYICKRLVPSSSKNFFFYIQNESKMEII